MNLSIPLLILSLVYMIFITSLFLLKKKIPTFENKIYFSLLLTTLIGVIIDIFGIFGNMYLPDTSFIRWLIVKIYMLYLLTFVFLMTIYIVLIGDKKSSQNRHHKLFIGIIIFVYLISFVLNFILPFNYVTKGTIVYIYGLNSEFLYGITGASMLIWVIYIFIRRKHIEAQKVLPVITFILLCIPVILIQYIYPELLVVTSLTAFIMVFMYHTIENPDVNMLEEFKVAKEKSDNSNKEKEIFLYNLTQDLRRPLFNIRETCEVITTEDDKNKVKEGIYYIRDNTRSLIDSLNNVLDVTNMELNNIKVYNSKYDILLLLKELTISYKDKVKENVDFRINIDSDIPKYLYGDSIRLKQVLTVLLDNAFKYTKQGFIELIVNQVTKNDISRLIITVEDSGCGIKASDINYIFSKDNQLHDNLEGIDDNKKNLAIAKSIITILGGVLMLDTEISKGSKITIVLDQKIVTAKSKELEKMEDLTDKYINASKIMLVSEDNTYLEETTKKLSKYDIIVQSVDLGAKCLEKVRNNNKYSLIILDEGLSKLSPLEVLNKLKDIEGFNTPVAILTDNPDNVKFISDGFSYILDRKISKKEVEEVIDKTK